MVLHLYMYRQIPYKRVYFEGMNFRGRLYVRKDFADLILWTSSLLAHRTCDIKFVGINVGGIYLFSENDESLYSRNIPAIIYGKGHT